MLSKLISLLLSLLLVDGSHANDHNEVNRKTVNSCCPTNTLTLQALCANNVKADCIEAGTISSDAICTDSIAVPELCTEAVKTQKVCAQDANVARLCVRAERVNELCADRAQISRLGTNNLNAHNVCISGSLRSCSPLSARAAASSDYLYNLGDVLTFDLVLADSSGSIEQLPTRYIAPESGNYLITAQINTRDLTGPTIISGVPVGVVEIYVEGLLRRKSFVPYLAFSTEQSVISTSLIHLNQNDEVLVRYKVLVLDPSLGLIEYPGQVTVLGAPVTAFRSFIFIHYLSSDCDTLECPPCDLQCENIPCFVPCPPCNAEPACEPCCPKIS